MRPRTKALPPHLQAVISDTGTGNLVEIHPSVEVTGKAAIRLSGNGHHLVIGPGTKLAGCLIELRNQDSSVQIGAGCVIGGQLRCRAPDTHIAIGDKTTIMAAVITLHEAGRITLGADCMLSGNITMDVSDMHSILDAATGTRINPPQDIHIADHVWIAQGVQVMKGATIGADCVIGARALVTGDIPPGSLAIGAPARVQRSGVTWDRARLPWDEGASDPAPATPARSEPSQDPRPSPLARMFRARPGSG
ncbi:acyltransferase [Tateyamaria omphalii]|uniref:acyltransferase n=1 Tax=Tateyamaria omphalii TaxID=299262 RepID=UPI001C9999FE|nr:acyltransferase [Tateyamaria omphalii]MBY5935561.1 acyltransferase [Tateyamaria omphalii]